MYSPLQVYPAIIVSLKASILVIRC
jgi:hypothetical protein